MCRTSTPSIAVGPYTGCAEVPNNRIRLSSDISYRCLSRKISAGIQYKLLRSIQESPFNPTIRLAALGAITTLSVIALAIGGYTLSSSSDSPALIVVIPVLTFFTLLPSIVFSLVKAVTPVYIFIENVWLAILWILWLATASDAANYYSQNCSGSDGPCGEVQAFEAFSWLTWLILFGYVPSIFVAFVLNIMAQSHRPEPVQLPQQQQIAILQPVYQLPVIGHATFPPQNQAPVNPRLSQVSLS